MEGGVESVDLGDPVSGGVLSPLDEGVGDLLVVGDGNAGPDLDRVHLGTGAW